jgi:D-cysteine desulfhydrase family pyridoxal phosphate-dependent enzyme
MLPREEFAHLPTAIDHLPRLSRSLGGPELLIKRDDQTGLAFGGNKTRKLEYLLGDARSKNADMVLSTGAAQSNHCRQTAAAAARCGLDCTLVLVGPEPEVPSANYFLDLLLGAKIVWTEIGSRDLTLERTFLEAGKSGANPYLIPYGGSNALGAYAYYQAYQELLEQRKGELPDWIVFASSSGGTQAGLFLASQVFNGPRVLGISVDEPEKHLRDTVARISGDLARLLGLETVIDPVEIQVNAAYTGEGYGIMNERDRDAIRLFADAEGILLDPVYTGRAAGGLVDLIREGFFDKDHKVLFWHTGGTPGLFADQYLPKI